LSNPHTFIATLALCCAAAVAAAAAERPEPGPWQFEATTGLNLSQSAFSNNWAGGDQGAINWVLNADVKAERQVSPSLHWSNLLQLAYGQTTKQEPDPDDRARKVWSHPDKTTDLVLFESVGRFTLGAFVDPYLSFRLDTQFLDEGDPYGRNILFNPVKLTQSGGVARVLEKTEEKELIMRVGFGLRESFARTYVDSLAEETTSFTTTDGGFEWQTDATYPLLDKKVLYRGKLLIFLPLFYNQSTDLEDFDAEALLADPGREAVADFWKAPDVNFQNTFSAGITEWLSVNLYLQLVYDKFDAATDVDNTLPLASRIQEIDGGIRKAGQFKQTLALGLTYRLF
jgi:hypothetical protein